MLFSKMVKREGRNEKLTWDCNTCQIETRDIGKTLLLCDWSCGVVAVARSNMAAYNFPELHPSAARHAALGGQKYKQYNMVIMIPIEQ